MGVVTFVLMIVAQYLSTKLPKLLQKQSQKKNKVKTKEYANDNKKEGPMDNMESMNIMMVAMIAVLAINWPLGMSFYWLVSSCVRMVQNVVIQKYFIDKK